MSYILAQFGGLSTLVQNMQSMGFFQYLFPFLLALAIVYGVLIYALPKEFPKSAKGLISLIVAFFVMLYASWTSNVVQFLANISGYWLMVGSGVLLLFILLGIVGLKPADLLFTKGKTEEGLTGKGWILILVLLAIGVLIVFGAGIENVVGVPGWVGGSDLWTIVFFVVILAIVFYFMGKGEGEKPAKV